MNMDVLVRNKAVATSALFAVALALAVIAALQAQPRLFTPSIPLIEPWIQPTTVEPSVPPAAPATLMPQIAPSERETSPVTPASEASTQPSMNTTAPPVRLGPPEAKPLPTPLPAQPKTAPDGRPMGDFDLPLPGSREAWKGGVDY